MSTPVTALWIAFLGVLLGGALVCASSEGSSSVAVTRPDVLLEMVPPWARVSSDQLREARRLGVPVALRDEETDIRFVLIPGREGIAPFYLQMTEMTVADYLSGAADAATPDEVLSLASPAKASEGPASVELRWLAAAPPKPIQPVVAVDEQRGMHLVIDEHAIEVAHHAYPIGIVSLEGVRQWLGRDRGRSPAGRLRLPTRAEWEHACRAGSSGPWYWRGATTDAIVDAHENVESRASDSSPSRVGAHRPNPWGVYDMLGNVAELCSAGVADPPASKSLLVLGSTSYLPVRPPHEATRLPPDLEPHVGLMGVGLRLVREISGAR